MRRLDFPRFLVSAIEAEGLFNDATALVAYKVAVAAVVGASFSIADAGLRFVVDAAGGVAIGLAVGWLIAEIRARTDDIQTSITISLFSGYAAFIPANAVGASGVLAAVTTGIYMGVRGPSIISAADAPSGFLRLGDARLRAQREPVRARRAAADEALSRTSTGHSAGSRRAVRRRRVGGRDRRRG